MGGGLGPQWPGPPPTSSGLSRRQPAARLADLAMTLGERPDGWTLDRIKETRHHVAGLGHPLGAGYR